MLQKVSTAQLIDKKVKFLSVGVIKGYGEMEL
jgi:hypothetical protein